VLVPQGIGRTLADDDAGSHGIAGGHARHDRAVGNAKVFDPIDLKLNVYDRHRIASHFRGTRLMVVSGGRIANEVMLFGPVSHGVAALLPSRISVDEDATRRPRARH
jgi:hypothetical protein